MSSQVSAVPSSVQSLPTSSVNRPSATFHPSIWGDQFLSFPHELQKLIDEVRGMLMNPSDGPSQKLNMIDLVQRLGVAYHFEPEIEGALNEIAANFNYEFEYDLYTAALQFRLLRQQGIKVSSDTFEKFKDCRGNFKECLLKDVRGMLTLYEAAHLGIRGEDILDEAIAFTTAGLQAVLNQLNIQLAEQVRHALNRPIRKCPPRLEIKHYISSYSDESHNKTLLKFAKMDFNLLQGLHQEELSGITKWWKNEASSTKFPYARDRIVECYFWVLGIYFEPKYALARKIMTKIVSMLSIVDDTYDAYGTNEELQLLTESIQRWDTEAADMLPESMRKVYLMIFRLYNDIGEEMEKQGMSFAIHYAKEAMKKVVQCFHVESKWRDEGYIPTFEEYMQIALFSCSYPMLSMISFLGIVESSTKEAIEWVQNFPKIVEASSIICRLMDDIVSHTFEQERRHVASSIECYLKQYGGASKEEAIEYFRKEIVNAWKDINEQCLKPTPVPRSSERRSSVQEIPVQPCLRKKTVPFHMKIGQVCMGWAGRFFKPYVLTQPVTEIY
ncbi:hypothetical protein K2173_003538 [Erythroxylum novogranatense]|uniref:Uncharacterized protein n=1 Tax=Erythroxylum novogranatense TaxID=1862640 RepID=A0AAV8TBM8_9ROSI|nr:hypothetical protein K2173_003538 [Erythroxylum novogranatense]